MRKIRVKSRGLSEKFSFNVVKEQGRKIRGFCKKFGLTYAEFLRVATSFFMENNSKPEGCKKTLME